MAYDIPSEEWKNMFCFVLFEKRPIIFAHNAFQPIKALWGSIKQQIKFEKVIKKKVISRVIKSTTGEGFVISVRETNTGCAQRELMEEQEEMLYNKGILSNFKGVKSWRIRFPWSSELKK